MSDKIPPKHTDHGNYRRADYFEAQLKRVEAERDEAKHAPAHQGGCKCADCTMDKEPCPRCYAAWWKKRHPDLRMVGVGDTELNAMRNERDALTKELAEHTPTWDAYTALSKANEAKRVRIEHLETALRDIQACAEQLLIRRRRGLRSLRRGCTRRACTHTRDKAMTKKGSQVSVKVDDEVIEVSSLGSAFGVKVEEADILVMGGHRWFGESAYLARGARIRELEARITELERSQSAKEGQ
jgi:hypothetical protein